MRQSKEELVSFSQLWSQFAKDAIKLANSKNAAKYAKQAAHVFNKSN